ncbi:hypothetical protein yrohd0001_20460 [Yersinia rohdei ATCC 43380]|nr:hypothetical protein yrohd0001_20460 [Yersinia rohdei ATCC 43380]
MFLASCAPADRNNEQDLTPIYPQIYWITSVNRDHWFNLQP